MSTLPKVLQYQSIKPKGFATKYNRWQVNPLASYNSFAPNELVRFTLDTDGWIDPYASYLDVTIQCDDSTMGYPGVAMLDGPSTSIIQELVVYINSKEVERISEYDQLGNILADIGYDQLTRFTKDYEGFGFEQIPNNLSLSHKLNTQSQIVPRSASQLATGVTGFRPDSLLPNYRSYLSTTSFPPLNYIASVVQYNSFFNQSTNQLNDLYRTDYAITSAMMDAQYGIDGPNAVNNTALDTGQPNQYSYQGGYILPYGTSFSGNKQQYFCSAGNILKIQNGFTNGGFQGKAPTTSLYDMTPNQNSSNVVTVKRFIIPILSGMIGILIPREQWKLIPGRALKDLRFEWRLNPYAFFTSGYSGVYSLNQILQRNWKILNFQMVFDIWQFDQEVERQMDIILNGEGLILSSQSFSMGPLYQINGNGGSVTNNWQINNGIESLKSLFVWFISNDYQKYTYCRKHFRLSMNITSLQLKVGGEYIPTYPITGHAGNIDMNKVIVADNTEFVVELHKTLGKLFSKETEIQINKGNFAPNDRCYIPNQFLSSLDFGQAMFHETRYVGKALFVLGLDSNPMDSTVLSGLDTTKRRPIELILKADQGNSTPRDATMYIMAFHDYYVQFKIAGTTTYGSG